MVRLARTSSLLRRSNVQGGIHQYQYVKVKHIDWRRVGPGEFKYRLLRLSLNKLAQISVRAFKATPGEGKTVQERRERATCGEP
jgi:hypothetical protein